MADLKKLTLDTVAKGAAPQLFAHELEKVLENIKDPNTGAGTRQIILTVTFDPHEEQGTRNREEMQVSVQAKTKLRPFLPTVSHAFISRKGGALSAYAHDVHQGDVFDEPEGEEEGSDESSAIDIGSRRAQ